MISALWSEYIIDGARMDSIPGIILEEACGREPGRHEGFEPIVDDTVDETPASLDYDIRQIPRYTAMLSKASRREIPMSQAGQFTKSRLAGAIVDAIWKTGHYCLEDLKLSIRWKWNQKTEGAMAAFYESACAVCDSVRELGIALSDYSYEESEVSSIEASVSCDAPATVGKTRKARSTMGDTPSDWIVYIPFDDGEYCLGASLLAQVTGNSGGMAPALDNMEYFADCHEVVRELVEDGIVTAGTSVRDGGLMAALGRFVPSGRGLRAQVGDLVKATGDKDLTRILFGEIPGVLIEISDDDYDYLDAELLLQEVVYYPLGHPSGRFQGVRVSNTGPSDISGIIGALLNGQASEGED